MPVTNVTVKDKWLPTGKKRWVIKGMDDVLYGADAGIAGLINKGTAYDLNWEINHWNGVDYKVVKGATPAFHQSVNSAAAPQSVAPVSDPTEKDIDIATLAIAKCWLEKTAPGDQAAGAHILWSARALWLEHKRRCKARKVEPEVEMGGEDIPY